MEQVGQVVEQCLNTARYDLGGAGIQTSALAFGGIDTANTGATEEYDGTSWTAGDNLNTTRFLV
jgi:hypothetical protein